MKISIIIFFCAYSVLYTETVQGQLVDNFFGTVKKTATTVTKELPKILGLKPEEKNKIDDNKDKSAGDKQDVGKTDDGVKAATVRSPTEATPTAAVAAKETPVPTTTPKGSAKNETAKEKDGRENFGAGCADGYLLTPDGRCMPEYK